MSLKAIVRPNSSSSSEDLRKYCDKCHWGSAFQAVKEWKFVRKRSTTFVYWMQKSKMKVLAE